MKILVTVVSFLLALSTFQASAEDSCPLLPRDVGLTWQQSDGPDFTVCYAVDQSKTQLFGLYTGMAPNFERANRIKAEKSKVAGMPAQWFLANQTGKPAFFRESVVDVHARKGPDYQAHIWIQATDRAQLAKAMSVLAAIRFEY